MKFILHTTSQPEEVLAWLTQNIDPVRRLPHKMTIFYYGKVQGDSFELRPRNGSSLMMRIQHKGSFQQDAAGTRVEVRSRFGIFSLLYFLFFFIPSLAFALLMGWTFLYNQVTGVTNGDLGLETTVSVFLLLIPWFFWMHFYLKGRSDMRRLHVELRIAFKETAGEYA